MCGRDNINTPNLLITSGKDSLKFECKKLGWVRPHNLHFSLKFRMIEFVSGIVLIVTLIN